MLGEGNAVSHRTNSQHSGRTESKGGVDLLGGGRLGDGDGNLARVITTGGGVDGYLIERNDILLF